MMMQLNTIWVMLTANSVTYTVAELFILFTAETLSRTLEHCCKTVHGDRKNA